MRLHRGFRLRSSAFRARSSIGSVSRMFGRGSRRGLRLGSRERHRLRSSLNHVRRLDAARRKHLPQRMKGRVKICSSVIARPECSSFISFGSRSAQNLHVCRGCVLRTSSMAYGPWRLKSQS
jgi:hypothetical protein